MTDIVHSIVRHMAAQLELLDTWDCVFGLCFVSQDGEVKQVERYRYVDQQDPDPLIVSPTDTEGTYIYIREVDDEITGQPYENYEDSSCGTTGTTVKKRLRAVAVSSKYCFPVELATALVFNIQDVSFSTFTKYRRVEDIRVEYVSDRNGIKTLYEMETGLKPMSGNIEMAAFDFDLTFNYPTSCSDDTLPNLC